MTKNDIIVTTLCHYPMFDGVVEVDQNYNGTVIKIKVHKYEDYE